MTAIAVPTPRATAPRSPAPAPRAARIQSIDLLRGLVMVIMAIDHVRVYAGQPPGGPTAGIFFTRWITNFAAPAFCFFAGTGAFFNGRKLGSTRALARYLLERGALLIVLELTLLRESWTFNFDYAHFIQGNVIWVLGLCMILLAGLVRFPAKAVGLFGLAVVFQQQLVGLIPTLLPPPAETATHWFWQLVYLGGKVELGGSGYALAVIYSVVPWIGVMAAGYGFGAIMQLPAGERHRRCRQIGLTAILLFVVGAAIQQLLHTPQPGEPALLFRYLGQRKYPASELFLLMTLGPTIALIPWAEALRGRVAGALLTFGRVPMFYYLLHIPLIHLMAVGVSLLRTGAVDPWLFGNHPWAAGAVPPGYMWGLPLLYLVWALALVPLYLASRWFGALKARRPASWLRYL